jgi:exopolysaccharide biosynthesis polyprenyl glycosylphosphotransferase
LDQSELLIRDQGHVHSVAEPARGYAAVAAGRWRDATLRRVLAAADVATALAVSASFFVIEHDLGLAFWSTVYVPVWIVLAKLHGLYDRDQRTLRHLTIDELPSIFGWAVSASALLAGLLMLAPGVTLPIATLAQCWLIAVMAALVFRSVARFLWRKAMPAERAIVVGGGALGAAVHRKLALFPDTHAVVVAELDQDRIDELCADRDLRGAYDRVILAASEIEEHHIAALVDLCRREGMKLSVVPPARGMFGTAVQLKHISDLPVIEYNTWDVSRSTLLLKRVLDVVVSAVALVLLSPLLLAIALGVVLDSGWPIFFVQTRAGVGGRPFPMVKFRTMVPSAEEMLQDLLPFESLTEPMFKLKNDPRVTRFGARLRKTSLDELPQFLNVFVGHMSLVGPRPEQIELVERYEPEHEFRLSVRPGLTGPMQVYGRGRLTFEERLAVEREYIENLSLGRDIRILAMTLPCVMAGDGAY